MNEGYNIFYRLNTLSGETEAAKPYSVPCDYFSTFTQHLLDRISDESEMHLLLEISRGVPFAIPDTYFSKNIGGFSTLLPSPAVLKSSDNLKGSGSNVIHDQKTTILSGKIWRKIAAAAIITGLLVSLSFIFVSKKGEKDLNVQVTNLTEQKIHKVPTEQLEGFLNFYEAVPDSTSSIKSSNSAKNTVDFNQLFEKVSDKDLRSFLDESSVGEEEFLLN